MIISIFRKTQFHTVLCLFAFSMSAIHVAAQVTGDIPYLTKTVDLEAIADTSAVDNSIDLEPVTITFSKAQDVRSPQNVQLISSDIKQLFGRQSVPQILNTLPGVLMHSGAYNTNRITIRGIGSRNLFGTAKIKAYLNDIPLTNGVGETSLEDIDLSLIEDIQVIKGPTSSLYGAGLGGMIHLNTKSNQDQPSQLSIETAFGKYGLQSSVVSADIRIKGDHRILGNYNTTESEGYRNNNNYKRKGFALIGEHKVSNKVRLSWIANYVDLFGQIPSSLNLEDYTNDPTKAAFTWQQVNGFEDYTKFIAGISAAIQTSDKSIWKVSLFTNSFDSYESRPFNIIEEDNSAIGLRSTFKQSINTDLDINLGIEGFSESYKWKTFRTDVGVQGDQISDNEEDRRYFNLFLNADYSFSEKLHLTGGLNLNSTKYDYKDLFQDMTDFSGSYKFDPVVSPYLNLNLDLAKDTESSMIGYALLSHGFSPPSLEETLQPDGQINPDIQPEKGLNLEIGLKGKSKEKFDYSLSLYSMTVKDLLVARRTGADQFIGINAGKTLHNGLEMSLGLNGTLNKFLSYRLTTDLAVQDYKFKDFVDGDDDYSGNPLTGTPKHIWRSQLALNISQGFEVGMGHYTLGSQTLRDDNSISFAGYTLWHAYLKSTVGFTDRFGVDLLLRAENIFDKKYASMLLINAGSFGGSAPRYYYPGLPANAYLSVKLNYRL